METLVLIQNPKQELTAIMFLVLIVAAVTIIGFLVTREIVLWYWRVNDVIRKQDEQIQQQTLTNKLLKQQNELLKQVLENKLQDSADTDSYRDRKSA